MGKAKCIWEAELESGEDVGVWRWDRDAQVLVEVDSEPGWAGGWEFRVYDEWFNYNNDDPSKPPPGVPGVGWELYLLFEGGREGGFYSDYDVRADVIKIETHVN